MISFNMKTTWKPHLGTFSKAVPDAIALNFSESGGPDCSATCEALKRNVCYAVHTERLKPSIQVSGQRKRELGFEALCHIYARKIYNIADKGKVIPWIRFSTFGTVPDRKLTSNEIVAFGILVESFPEGSPVHFPVETQEKADRFRAIAVALDLKDLVIRESCQSDERMWESTRPASRIVFDGDTKRERLANAVTLAATLPDARVCPAIASTILRRPKPVKCGQCTLCARGDVQMILYPMH